VRKVSNLQSVTFDNLTTHLELGRKKVKVDITDEDLLIHLIDKYIIRKTLNQNPL